MHKYGDDSSSSRPLVFDVVNDPGESSPIPHSEWPAWLEKALNDEYTR